MTGQPTGLAMGNVVQAQRRALRRAAAADPDLIADLIAGDGDTDLEVIALPMTIVQLLGPDVPISLAQEIARVLGRDDLKVALRDLPVVLRRDVANTIRTAGGIR